MENNTTAACWKCGGIIAPADNYCRFCGSAQRRRTPWRYTHLGIIALTVCGLGPFGLILVWKSPLLSQRAKWAYTAAIAAVTWYIAAKIYSLWIAILPLFNFMAGAGSGAPGGFGI